MRYYKNIIAVLTTLSELKPLTGGTVSQKACFVFKFPECFVQEGTYGVSVELNIVTLKDEGKFLFSVLGRRS